MHVGLIQPAGGTKGKRLRGPRERGNSAIDCLQTGPYVWVSSLPICPAYLRFASPTYCKSEFPKINQSVVHTHPHTHHTPTKPLWFCYSGELWLIHAAWVQGLTVLLKAAWSHAHKITSLSPQFLDCKMETVTAASVYQGYHKHLM